MCDFDKCKFDNTAKNNPRKLRGHFSDELKLKRNTLPASIQVVELWVTFFFGFVLFFFFLSEF